MANPSLTIDIGASTTKYDKAMQSIGDKADQTVAEIEQKFADFDPQLNTESYTKSLTSMVAGFGVAGVAVGAAIALVVNLNKSLSDTADLAERVGISTEKLQQLRFGANSLGLGDDSVNNSLDQFATKLQNAKFQANDLTRVFDANGVSIKKNNGELVSTDTLLQSAFDIIKRAPSPQDAIQVGGFLGFSKELSQALKQNGDQFVLLASQANAAGAVVDQATIDKAKTFTSEWNKAATIWSTQMKAAAGDILPLLNDAVKAAVAVINAVKSAYSFISAIKDFAIAPNIDTASLNQLNGLLKQYEDIKKTLQSGSVGEDGPNVGKLNPIQLFQGSNVQDQDHKITIDSVNAAIAQVKTRIDAFNNDPNNRIRITANNNPSNNPGPKITDSKDAVDEASDALNKHNLAVQADADAVGLGAAALARFRAEAAETAAVQKNGGEETADQAAKFKLLQDAAAAAAGALADAKIKDAISRGQQTALLDPQDVAIANQLKEKYSDVGEALKSCDSGPIRMSATFGGSSKLGEKQKEQDERVQHSLPKAA